MINRELSVMEKNINTDDGQMNVLMAKYLSGEASEEENRQFLEWLSADDDNMAAFGHVRSAWNAFGTDFGPDEIDSKAALRAVSGRISEDSRLKEDMPVRKVYHWRRIWSVLKNAAAILALPLVASTMWLSLKLVNVSRQSETVMEISALPGSRTAVSLPDGTRAWLNGGSKLEYPEKFVGKCREVSMEGEVYFEVDADKRHPFVVHTAAVDVTATGTRFNVEAYQEDSLVSVTLAEGIVEVGMEDTEAVLVPDTRLVYNIRTVDHEISQGEAYRWSSWKDGVLMFRNDPLSYVFKRLGQIYNVEFIVDKELRDDPYYATFKNDPLDRILSLLSKTAPISYRMSGKAGAVPDKDVIEVSCKETD